LKNEFFAAAVRSLTGEEADNVYYTGNIKRKEKPRRMLVVKVIVVFIVSPINENKCCRQQVL